MAINSCPLGSLFSWCSASDETEAVDSSEDSDGWSDNEDMPMSPIRCFDFNSALTLDSLFKRKPLTNTLTNVLHVGVSEVVTDPSAADTNTIQTDQSRSTSLESCLPSLSQINAKWEQDYPTADIGRCYTVSRTDTKQPRKKVLFVGLYIGGRCKLLSGV